MKENLRISTIIVLTMLFIRIVSSLTPVIPEKVLDNPGAQLNKETLTLLDKLDSAPNITHSLDDVDTDFNRAEDVKPIKRHFGQAHVGMEDIRYHFYNRIHPDGNTVIQADEVDKLTNTIFNASLETLLIIHGWDNNYTSNVNVLIKEAVLSKHDVNIIVVDWSAVAKINYWSARWSVNEIGKPVAHFLLSLVENFNLKIPTVSIVGHSLGAHVSGSVGATLKGQVNQIVGLDPAAPLVTYLELDERLDPSDAQFVQVIHTSGMKLGFFLGIGHADYYPNGGVQQPGCGLADVDGTCAHSRAYRFYAESIRASENLFISTKCSTYIKFSIGACKGNPKSVMGGYKVDKSASGTYYLDTAATSPYALG